MLIAKNHFDNLLVSSVSVIILKIEFNSELTVVIFKNKESYIFNFRHC